MTPKKTEHTNKGKSFTDLVLVVMRVHGLIREHGQRLTKPHGLSVARWSVLGAVGDRPMTVSQISRRMGVTRQNVQTVVNSMRSEGLVTLRDNPDHARAPLIELTPKAAKLLKALHADQRVWANASGENLLLREMTDSAETLNKLADVLEQSLDG